MFYKAFGEFSLYPIYVFLFGGLIYKAFVSQSANIDFVAFNFMTRAKIGKFLSVYSAQV
jgi:hypothetical protein